MESFEKFIKDNNGSALEFVKKYIEEEIEKMISNSKNLVSGNLPNIDDDIGNKNINNRLIYLLKTLK